MGAEKKIRDLQKARAERDAALKQVMSNTDHNWKERAEKWLLRYLVSHQEFFSEDAWDAGLEEPHDKRAFGPVIAQAARDGYIVRSGKLRPRIYGHATPGEGWVSTIYGASV